MYYKDNNNHHNYYYIKTDPYMIILSKRHEEKLLKIAYLQITRVFFGGQSHGDDTVSPIQAHQDHALGWTG